MRTFGWLLGYACGRIAFPEAVQGAEVERLRRAIGEVGPVLGHMFHKQGSMLGLVGGVIAVEVVDGHNGGCAGLVEVVVVVDDGASEGVAVLVEVGIGDGDGCRKVGKDEAGTCWIAPGRWLDGVYRGVCLGGVQWVVDGGRVELLFRADGKRCGWWHLGNPLMLRVHGIVVLPLGKGILVPLAGISGRT